MPANNMARRTGASGDARLELGAAALFLAEHVGPVFPLGPRSKVPLIPKAKGGNGCLDATRDLDQVAAWWQRCPAANIGLACGAACWVLDVDTDKGGDATLTDLEDVHRWLPEGPASVTGSGGMHILFAASDRVSNSVKRLGAGLDTRSAGGYIVAPPSIHDVTGQRYAWLSGREPWAVELPAAPAWILELLDPPKAAPDPCAARVRHTGRYVETAIDRELDHVATAGTGGRNNALFRAAAKLGRFVLSGEASAAVIGPELVQAGVRAGLSMHEAQRTAHSGIAAALREAR